MARAASILVTLSPHVISCRSLRAPVCGWRALISASVSAEHIAPPLSLAARTDAEPVVVFASRPAPLARRVCSLNTYIPPARRPVLVLIATIQLPVVTRHRSESCCRFVSARPFVHGPLGNQTTSVHLSLHALESLPRPGKSTATGRKRGSGPLVLLAPPSEEGQQHGLDGATPQLGRLVSPVL